MLILFLLIQPLVFNLIGLIYLHSLPSNLNMPFYMSFITQFCPIYNCMFLLHICSHQVLNIFELYMLCHYIYIITNMNLLELWINFFSSYGYNTWVLCGKTAGFAVLKQANAFSWIHYKTSNETDWLVMS